MNALTYVKNVGKSFGYASIDIFKEAMPSITSMASNAKELSSDLYQSVKDFKAKAIGIDGEEGFGKDIVKVLEDTKANFISDIKTGKWYNKQRINESEDMMFSTMMGGDFDDDFNFDFEFDDDTTDDSTEAVIANQTDTSIGIAKAMDQVGQKTTGAISMAVAESADYIVTANRSGMNALFGLNSRGFDQMSKGLSAINYNLSTLVRLAEPLNAHMQNSTTFYTHSTAFQEKALKLLEDIAKNTNPVDTSRSIKQRKTLDSLLTSEGGLDFKEIVNTVKESVSIYTDMVTSMLEMFGGVKGAGGMVSASPLKEAVTGAGKFILGKTLRGGMKRLNSGLSSFFGAGLSKLRDTSFGGPFGDVFNLLKDMIIPSSGYTNKIDPGKYIKGKIDWDGVSKKALTDVIPTQLAQIIALLSGSKELSIYNYDTGRWTKTNAIRGEWEKQMKSQARGSNYEVINYLESMINQFTRGGQISSEQGSKYKEQINDFFVNAFHSNNSDYKNILNKNFDYKKYGLDKSTWEMIRRSLISANEIDPGFMYRYINSMESGKDRYGDLVRRKELEGDIFTKLYDGTIDDTEKPRILIGIDSYGNDIFYYLQGIYQNTAFVSENLPNFARRGTKLRGVGIKSKGQTRPISSRTAMGGGDISKEKSKDIDKKYENSVGLEQIQLKDIDAIASAVLSDDFKIDVSKLDKDLVEYKQMRDAGLVEKDEEKEKRLAQLEKTNSLINDQIKKIKTKAGNNPAYNALIARITELFRLPAKVGTDIMDAINVSMTRVIYGEDAVQGRKGIFAYFEDGMKNLFDKLDNKVEQIFKFKPSELFKKAWNKLAGEKGEDGKRSGGVLSNFVNETNENLRGVGDWFKNTFSNGFASRGRRVTKTGLVAVSEGELIIPAEYNPFYNGKVDKRDQYKKEHDAARKFFGFYESGGTATDNIVQFPGSKNTGSQNTNGDLKGEGAGRTSSFDKIKDTKTYKAGKDFFMSGVNLMGSAIKEVFEKATQKGKTIYADRFGNSAMVVDENEEDGIKKLIDTGMKEAGINKGAMGAGAIVGAGVSLLTGAFVGPILGAGIGAAAGLVIKSKKVQDILFGNDEKGGLVPKNISEFVRNQLPNTTKGAVLGGTAGLFLGSPVLGMILGGAVGYVSASDKAKRFLFGDEDNDDGIIKKKTQEMIKQRIPGISAGTILGLLAGPFGSPIMNLAVGSVVGYAATGDKFHKWLFGEEGTEDKGFVGMINENFFKPLVGIFDKLAEQMRHTIRASFNNVAKATRKILTDWFKGTIIGRGIRKVGQKVGGAVDKVVKTPTRLIGRGLRGLNNRMEARALERGYRVKDEEGNLLTAEQRQARRRELGVDDYKFKELDDVILAAQESGQLDQLRDLANQMIDPTKAYDKQIRDSRGLLKNTLNKSNIFNKDRIYKLAAQGKYEKAIDIVVKNNNITQEEKQKLLDQINNLRNAYKNRKVAKTNTNEAKKQLYAGSGLKGLLAAAGVNIGTLSDEDLRNLAELTGDQIVYKKKKDEEENTPEKKMEKAVTSDIPSLLKDIAEILAKNPKKIQEYQGDSAGTDQQRQEQAKEEVEAQAEAQKPDDGDIRTITDDNGNTIRQIYDSSEGGWNDDLSHGPTKAARAEQKETAKGLASLSKLGSGIKNLFGKIGKGIFGEKDEEEEGKRSGGLIGKVLEFFTGNGKFNLGSILGKVLKGALVAAGLWGLLSGKFDDLGKSLGISSSGTFDKGTYTGENGEILVKENGKYINQETGEEYTGYVTSNNDASFSYRHASLAERARYNAVRGAITGKGSVAVDVLAKRIPGYKAVTGKIKGSKVGQKVTDFAQNKVKSAGKTVEGFANQKGSFGKAIKTGADKVADTKAFKKAADVATNSTFIQTIAEALSKFATMLTKVPVIKNVVKSIDMSKMIQSILDYAQKNVARVAAKIGLDGISAAIPVLNAVFFVTDFMSGFNNANSILKIANKPSFGQKIVCGLLEAIKGLIPIIGSLIPTNVLVDIFMNFVAPALGINVEELKKDRDEAQEQLDAYNAEHGTDLTWDEYNKKVLGNQGILEKAVSGVKNLGNAIGSGVHNVATGIKNAVALPFKAGKKLGASLKERGVLGTAQDIGKWFKTAGEELDKLSDEGKMKDFLAYDGGTEDPTMKAIQSVPLNLMKLTKMPGALISTGIKGVKNLFTSGFDNIATNFNSFNNALNTMRDKALAGKPGEVFNTKTEYGAKKGPLTIIYSVLGFIAKLIYGIIGTVTMIANPIVEFIKHPVKSIKNVINTILWGNSKDKEVDEDTSTDITIPEIETTQQPVSSGASQTDQEAIAKALEEQQAAAQSASGSGFISQLDPKYAGMRIGNTNVANKGCGPASAVMAMLRNGKNVSMKEATNIANQYQTGAGTNIRYFGDIFNRNGMNATYYFSGGNSMVDDIRSGKPVVLMGQDPYNTSKNRSPFGPNNHYVVANGMDRNGNIIINDPESMSGSRAYSSRILNSVKAAVSAGRSGLNLRRFFGGDSGQYPHTVRNDATTQAIWSFFRAKGYSEAAVAGIMGNAQAESGIDPTRVQTGAGHAAGLFQWESYKNRSGRWKAMADYAASKGKDWTDLNSQLEYAQQEIQGLGSYFKKNCNTTVEGFMNMTDPSLAAQYFEKAFERAGKPHMENRIKYAIAYYQMFTGKEYTYDSSVGSVNANSSSAVGISGVSSTSGTTSSTSTSSGESFGTTSSADTIKSMGVLGAITNAFSKIGNFFNGGSEDTETSSSSTTTASTTDNSSDTTGTTSTNSSTGVTDANAKVISFTGGNDPVGYMQSILGKISYSMQGPRNPEKGSADCSSTVQWAIKKAGGPDIGGNTGSQYNDSDLTPVWYNNGQIATEIPSGLKRNDVLFFRRDGDYTKGRQDRVGHVGLYIGNGKYIDHGSGMGPKIKNLDPQGSQLIKASRITGMESGSGSGLSKSRLILFNDRRPIGNKNQVNSISYQYSGGATGNLIGNPQTNHQITTTSNNKNNLGISKDTAAMLQIIITLIEQLIKNTTNVTNIYNLLTTYCQNMLGAQGTQIARQLQQASTSDTDDVERSLSALKNTMSQILAS